MLAAKSMTAHGALRRQKQLIGKIMRETDPDPIRAAIDSFGRQDRITKQIFREAEAWRERLTEDAGGDLGEFFELTGHRNDVLAEAVASWFTAPNDEARRLIRRKIFREVHNDLTSKMQATTSSI